MLSEDDEGTWNALCQNESPVTELQMNYGRYRLTIISGFPSSDHTSPFTAPKSFQEFRWIQDYEFVWVAADGCLYHSG